ncbi:MAG: alpha-ketoacid dehydrogenase subunit beta [Rhodospirillaceae bacterium]|jgi:pyruvate dehydrogenase E1 component beta subunit|nr:alpha-ketoacid dehydrogenase subunit beta [Rhodospirillaceae bacterium]MBT4751489.1 alpha-ketoacid dehydrogenase subunit beta [Rhodospirillaceae bacterium]MBT5181231.1 alpha-ketoacid dehydrogenase subunit beta [Rhodospirillaceae bacterium]MBT5841118.1 alpha-ketoacid dehydrogenase subunit beta [Rhodospirillaceae bacterium]MBT6291029.1 alpha-ketoacid dehydrogenase subunit beta [Rhodospirillaceae bacterium]
MPGDSQTLSLKEAVLSAIFEEMEADERVIMMGEDIGAAGGVFKQTEGLFARFGAARIIDTPISESAIFGLAVGAAMTGSRPIVEIMFGDFITLVMDQLVNQAAKVHYMSAGGYSVPLVLKTGIGVGGNLGPQHSQSLHAWLAHIPGLKVVMPATPADAKGLMKAAIRDNNPVIFAEDRMTYNLSGPVPAGDHLVPLGKADIKRQGADLTLITISRMVHTALAAAETLAEKSIDAEVVDLRCLAPLDMETVLTSVKKTGRALVLDGAHLSFGITGEIAASIGEAAFDYLDAPVMRLAGPDHPVPYSPALEQFSVPGTDQVVAKVDEMLG